MLHVEPRSLAQASLSPREHERNTYRPDIDGLRCIAVLSVVFYHAGVPGFGGGYVGVDIFFVISGYLITSIIAHEVEAGNFSITTFYKRRIRRIFPALFFMTAIVTAIACIVLIPSDLNTFGQSLFATALFYSNIHFNNKMDYFASLAAESPLLHTWSLGVEEQFYILWPVFIILLFRQKTLRFNKGLILLFVCLASLAYAEWDMRLGQGSAFYLLPGRIWELGLGAALAIGCIPAIRSEPWRNVISLGGIGLIAYSVVCFSDQTLFPGLNALPPCLGAAMLIATGEKKTIGGSLLSLKPFVWVGLISYSLYLWHWPMLVLLRLNHGAPPTYMQILATVTASFCIAAFSYRFVERPFREDVLSGRWPFHFFPTAAVTAVLFASFGVAFNISNGLPQRVTSDVLEADAIIKGKNNGRRECELSKRTMPKTFCAFGVTDNKNYDLVIWGDSHAGHYLPAVEKLAQYLGLSGLLLRSSGCPPLLGVLRVDGYGKENHACAKHNENSIKLIQQLKPKYILLASRWSVYTENVQATSRNLTFLINEKERRLNAETSRRVFAVALEETLEALSQTGARIMLLDQIPEFPMRVAQCVARRRMSGEDELNCVSIPRRRMEERAQVVMNLFQYSERKRSNVFVFRPYDFLCDKEFCSAFKNREILYRDDNHLSENGSLFLLPFLREFFNGPYSQTKWRINNGWNMPQTGTRGKSRLSAMNSRVCQA